MPRIVLSKSAIAKLMMDPNLKSWRDGRAISRVPLLGYYSRSYMTLHDGTIIEHGDGFMLTSIDPFDARETRGTVLQPTAVADGLSILVGGDKSVMSNGFTIGWTDGKFTFDPETSPPRDSGAR